MHGYIHSYIDSMDFAHQMIMRCAYTHHKFLERIIIYTELEVYMRFALGVQIPIWLHRQTWCMLDFGLAIMLGTI